MRTLVFWICISGLGYGQDLVGRIQAGLGNGEFEAVEPLVEELVAEWRQAGDSVELGRALHTLGLVKDAVLKPEEAVVALEEAGELLEDEDGLGDVLDALGKARQHTFDFEGAEAAFRTALELRDGEWVDVTRDHLGLLYLETGRVSEAGVIFNATLERTAEGNIDLLVQRHGYLGRFHVTVRNFGRARAHFEEAISLSGGEGDVALRAGLGVALMRAGNLGEARAVLEGVVDGTAEDLSVVLNNLGAVLIELGEPELAAQRFEEGRVLVEQMLGKEHAGMAVWYNNTGIALERAGKSVQARAAFEAALDVTGGQVIESDELRARVWNNLAVNALREERGDEAREAAWRAADAARGGLVDVTGGGNEGQRLNYKARTDVHSVLCSLGGEEGKVLNLILSTSDVVGGTAGDGVTWEQVQGGLGDDTVWVRFVRFWDFVNDEAGYGAYLVTGAGDPTWVRLGSESKLERWLGVIAGRIDALAGKGSAPVLTMEAGLRALDEVFWRPLELVFPPGVETVWVTPDGGVHFVSLAVLLGEDGRFLCERIAQLVVAENAGAVVEERAEARRGEWRVLGVSDYGGRELDRSIYPESLVDFCSSLEALGGVDEELRAVAAVARRSGSGVSVTGNAGTADLGSADVLHLAAHGFFLGGGRSGREAGLIDFDFDPEFAMESGVVMSRSGDDDGVVFSPELAGLNLEGGWIAAVSSCESGLGTAVSGEGVVGLRRALSQTGVENVVLALWPVADQAAARVMGAFYDAAVSSGNAPGAMWAVQREMLAGAMEGGRFEETVMEVGAFVVSHRGEAGKPIRQVEIAGKGRGIWWWVLFVGGAGFVLLLLRFFSSARADSEKGRAAQDVALGGG